MEVIRSSLVMPWSFAITNAHMPAVAPFQTIFISREEWKAREAAHRARVVLLAEGFLERRAVGMKHPVWDFLFTYYNFAPSKLMTWVPGMTDLESQNLDAKFEPEVDSVSYEWPEFQPRDVNQAAWIAQLCGNVLSKPARFACHGLHEWAMVYRQNAEELRHQAHGLRLTQDELAAFIESQTICCSHYDAFRFFTAEANPRNTLKPTLETRQEMEQGGCLHTSMDLYKWAYKLWPWIGSDLVADAFEVAVAGRLMDMRASPYDLEALGIIPIRIETEEGREEYRREQQRITALAEPVRVKLRDACLQLIELNS
jgi:hypothetical protein